MKTDDTPATKLPTTNAAREARDAAKLAHDDAIRARDALTSPAPTRDEVADLDAMDEFDRQRVRAERLIAMRAAKLAEAEATFTAAERRALHAAADDARHALTKDTEKVDKVAASLMGALAKCGLLAFVSANAESARAFEGSRDALNEKHGERIDPLDDEAATLARLSGDLAKTPEDDAPAMLRAAAALSEFVAKRAERQRERDERARAHAAEVDRRFREECRRGEHGEAARQRVIEEELAALRQSMWPGRGAMVIEAQETTAARELSILRKNAGLE